VRDPRTGWPRRCPGDSLVRVRTSIRSLLVLLLGVAAATPAAAQEGGIEVFAAETLFATGTRVSVTHIEKRKGTLYDGGDAVSDPLGRVLDERKIVAAVDHGLRADLTLSALLPILEKELESSGGDLRSSGVGDFAVLAKYRLYKQDWRRGAFHVSGIGGVEVPTGSTSERDGGARLAPGLQPGLGAWNPFFGLSLNLNLDRFRFDALAFYKENTEGAQDFEKGDFLALEVDAAYRFYHAKYPGPSASAKVGLQWRHEGSAELDGASVVDSGSEELRLKTGLGWHPRPGIDISLSYALPIHEDYDGQQLGLDHRVSLGIGVRF
jgi:hypothetical protein